jgi:hypothetical protein
MPGSSKHQSILPVSRVNGVVVGGQVAGNSIFHRKIIFPLEIVDGQVGGQVAGNSSQELAATWPAAQFFATSQ